MMAAYSTVYIT